MNERIKELMLEAGYAAPEIAGRANKFAELIVQECADWVVNNADAMEHLGPEYFAKAMTKDFGVEE